MKLKSFRGIIRCSNTLPLPNNKQGLQIEPDNLQIAITIANKLLLARADVRFRLSKSFK